MSPLPANLNIAEAVIIGKINDEAYRNVIHFATEETEWDTNGLQLLTTLATQLSAQVVGGWLASQSNEFTFIGISAQRIHPDKSDIVEFFTDAGPGGAAAQALPSFNACLVHKKSGLGGRKGRGRMFLPPPIEGNAEKGKLTAAGLAITEDLLDGLRVQFLTPNNTSVWVIGVLNEVYDDPAPPAKPTLQDVNWFPTKALIADALIAKQGRRKIGRGA